MRVDLGRRRLPAGTGWAAGALLAGVAAVAATLVSGRIVVGLVLLAATVVPLGLAFERALATRPLTPRQRRLAVALLAAGVVLGLVVLVVWSA